MSRTLIAAAAIAAAAFAGGWSAQGWRRDAAELQAAQARRDTADETRRLLARTATAAATNHEQFKGRERVIYQTITQAVDRIVDRPVYRSACFDADGLRHLNSAITGRAADPAPQPGPAVP